MLNRSLSGFNRIFCIGKNYINHAKEMESAIPEVPLVFMKPSSCLVFPGTREIAITDQHADVHYEAEVVLLIGKEGYVTEKKHADRFVKGVTLGLDLTLRSLQKQLKSQGYPWEKAKALDNSAPIGEFKDFRGFEDFLKLEFGCFINGESRQYGRVRDMIFDYGELLMEISRYWKLLPGDLLFTGTPEGVGKLKSGDRISLTSNQTDAFEWIIR